MSQMLQNFTLNVYKSGFVIRVHRQIVKFMIHQSLSLYIVCLKSSVPHIQFMMSNFLSILKMGLYQITKMMNTLFKSWVSWVCQG